jgi:hypothetical protein
MIGEEESFSDKFEPVLDGIKAFGIGKLIFIFLILAAALWFFVLAPKPGSLSVSVYELDSRLELSGVTVDLVLPDGKVRSKFTDDLGQVSFSEVPSEVDLTIRIRPPTTHQSAVDSARLKSGVSDSVSVLLGRNVKLELSSESTSLSLGTDCATSVPVSVRNLGAEPVDVSLVGDGALSGLVSSEPQVLQGGASSLVDASVTAPHDSGQSKGQIRVKFSNAKVPFSLDVTKPAELNVQPNRIIERVTGGQPLKKLISVRNNGRDGVLRDLKVEVTGEVASYIPTLVFSDNRPLGPGEENILTLIGDVPAFSGQKLVGVLLVSSSCRRVSIPIELEIQ